MSFEAYHKSVEEREKKDKEINELKEQMAEMNELVEKLPGYVELYKPAFETDETIESTLGWEVEYS